MEQRHLILFPFEVFNFVDFPSWGKGYEPLGKFMKKANQLYLKLKIAFQLIFHFSLLQKIVTFEKIKYGESH